MDEQISPLWKPLAMVRRLPPLNALRAFEAAARQGSFVRAADELNVTPTAVSHQVKGLEEFLGVDLFVRLPRGLRLTAQGAAYLPSLTRGFDQLARASFDMEGGALKGVVSVSTLPSFSHCWLIPRLPDFRARYPDLDVRITGTERKVDFLREGIDLGIRYGMGRYPGLRTTRFLEEEVFPVASPALLSGDHPLRTWGDLAHHTLIHDCAALAQEQWITWEPWLRRAGAMDVIHSARRVEMDNSAAMIEAAIRGQGAIIARTALVAEHLREGRLVTLFDARHPADFAYYAVAPEATADQPRVKAFTEWLLVMSNRDRAMGP